MEILTTIYIKEDKKPIVMFVIKNLLLDDHIIFHSCFTTIFHGVKLTEVITVSVYPRDNGNHLNLHIL